MGNRTYPHWSGIESFDRKVKAKDRKCQICGLDATRYGVVQYGWFRSDDERFGLCASNGCRDQLKTRECAIPKFQSQQPSAINSGEENGT